MVAQGRDGGDGEEASGGFVFQCSFFDVLLLSSIVQICPSFR